MSKQKLISHISETTGVTKEDADTQVANVIGAIEAVTDRGETVELRRFGVFRKTRTKERIVNGAAGRHVIPPRERLTFKSTRKDDGDAD